MKIVRAALFLAVSTAAFAQQFDVIRAKITGTSGDRGKCTVDVVVDGVVEIEVLGDQGRMRTVSGARGTWRRLECNMIMPANPGEFKFSPQEGRGRQTLVRNPNENRGTTMVRIEDSEGGSQGYKFDLEWRGTQSGLGNSGKNPPGNNNNGGNNNGGSIFNPPPGPQPGGGVFDNSQTAGWNDQVNYRGDGEGYYRSFRGSDEQLRDVQLNIERSGRVQVELNTARRDRILLTGRVVLVDGDRLVANLSGGTIQGAMEILLDSRNRVQELAMTGVGRNRFELRWQSR